MSEIHEPSLNFGSLERQRKCQAEMEIALQQLMAQAMELGWRDIEVAMALADAADDEVVRLAAFRAKRH